MTRILIVEDEKAVGRSYMRMLTDPAREIVLTGSIAEARAALRQHSFDLVLLDLRLGAERGTDLIPVLKSLRPCPAIAILSGCLESETAVRFNGQVQAMVPKPIGTETLLQLVKHLATKRAPEDCSSGFCHEHMLSPREADVLKSGSDGLQNKEIAELLGCKVSTVVTYWQRIFRKTRCQTKNEVLAKLFQCSGRPCCRCQNCPNTDGRDKPEPWPL